MSEGETADRQLKIFFFISVLFFGVCVCRPENSCTAITYFKNKTFSLFLEFRGYHLHVQHVDWLLQDRPNKSRLRLIFFLHFFKFIAGKNIHVSGTYFFLVLRVCACCVFRCARQCPCSRFFPATYSSSFAHETFSKEFILRRPDGVRDSQRLKIVAVRARQTRHLLISWYGIRRKKAVIRRKNFLFSPFTVSIKMSTLSQWFVSVCVALWRWKKNEDKKKIGIQRFELVEETIRPLLYLPPSISDVFSVLVVSL